MTEQHECRLADAPIGLFWYRDTLVLKTEYGNNEGRIDAYIVSSGEFFWGTQPQTIESQNNCLVCPVNDAELRLNATDRLSAEDARGMAVALRTKKQNKSLRERFYLTYIERNALKAYADALEGKCTT